MSTRCVTYPQDEPLVMIRTSQVRICEGNLCAAALLSYFERWHENRVDNAEQAEHKNKVAALHGETGMQDTSLLQYHTEEKMEAGLLHLYGRKTIRKAIDFLVGKGFLAIQSNPNPHYRFDKTHYFRFYPERVQAEVGVFVREVKVPHREGQNTSSQFTEDDEVDMDEALMAVHEVKMPDGEGENTSWSGKNAAPIEENNQEKNEEREEDPPLPPTPVSLASDNSVRRQPLRRKVSHLVPDDFVVTEEMVQWARDEVPGVDIVRETKVFRDCEFKTPHSDWVRAWRNWMRRIVGTAKDNSAPVNKADRHGEFIF